MLGCGPLLLCRRSVFRLCGRAQSNWESKYWLGLSLARNERAATCKIHESTILRLKACGRLYGFMDEWQLPGTVSHNGDRMLCPVTASDCGCPVTASESEARNRIALDSYGTGKSVAHPFTIVPSTGEVVLHAVALTRSSSISHPSPLIVASCPSACSAL